MAGNRSSQKKTKYSRNKEADSKIDMIDKLSQFEDFQSLYPELRKMLLEEESSKKILTKFSPLVAARLVNIAITEPDSAKAMSAIKQILDRSEGTPVQKQEVTHKYAELPENELDAILESQFQDLTGMQDDNTEKH